MFQQPLLQELIVNESDNISEDNNSDNEPDNEDLHNNVVLKGLKLARSKEEWDSVNAHFEGRFTRSNFDPINIENFCVRDGICWCSHDPVFASNYFVMSLKNFNNSCFENFMPTSPQLKYMNFL